jgi:hypothetical protein
MDNEETFVHTLIYDRNTGLLKDEFLFPYTPIVEDHWVNGSYKPCYTFHFPSGNVSFYPVKDFRWEHKGGFYV